MIIIRTTRERFNKACRLLAEVGKVEVEKHLDRFQGYFSAKGVIGKFSFDPVAEVLKIVIDDKPWLASDSMIEKEIKKFFN